jgi:glycosyltransferase 2 family protein
MLSLKRGLKFGQNYKYFVYISLLFLIFALYKAQYLKIPRIFSSAAITSSFLFLFFGFLSQAVCWKKILKISNYDVSFRKCLAGHGLSVFGKYVPGKIWTVIGRAVYISEKDYLPVSTLSAISFNEQFISIWVGLIFGITGLFLLHGFRLLGWVTLLLWVGLTVIIFGTPLYKIVEYFVKSLLKKNIKLPIITIKLVCSIMPWSIIIWASWSIGFYFLVQGLTTQHVPWSIAFGFPLAAILGILAFIIPGGIGVREGIITGYLSLGGIGLAEAGSIALVSRLWFLIGEIFIFSLGWVQDRGSQKI